MNGALLCLALLWTAGPPPQTPESVAQAFLEALVNRDVEKMDSLIMESPPTCTKPAMPAMIRELRDDRYLYLILRRLDSLWRVCYVDDSDADVPLKQRLEEYAARQAKSPSGRADGPASDVQARLSFAPLWIAVPRFPRPFNAGIDTPAPCAAYAPVWEPAWQEDLGLSDAQKRSLEAIRAQAGSEVERQSEQFQKLSPAEQKAMAQRWAGKPAPWRQRLDKDVCRQIEAVLTPQQAQTIREFAFPAYAVGLLYDEQTRRAIGFAAEQEDRFRRIAFERLARFQEMSMERAEKLWEMLTPEQKAALPEVVRRQGPTSAVLSIAWELGFDLDRWVPGHPMLSAAPVRRRLGLRPEQERSLDSLAAVFAARKAKEPQEQSLDREALAKKQVETILTPPQLTMLEAIDFRRKVALALGYPEKREEVGITPEQAARFERLDDEIHERRYRIDREMLGRALETLEPGQREQLRNEIDRRVYGR